MTRRSALLELVLVCLGSTSALASTFSVTNNGDRATGGTLRWAINAANTNPGPDFISFALSSTTIAPTGALPSVSDLSGGLVIDGTTQTGYSGTPLVKLIGTNAGASANGLFINTVSNVVKGLIITQFKGDGIQILSDFNTVRGSAIVSNSLNGIYVYDGIGNAIGGTNTSDRNVISGNKNSGVCIAGGSALLNTVLGNHIGVDATGLLKSSNAWYGVLVQAPSNRIGSATAGGRNVIAANASAGIRLSGSDAHHNIIEGNYCGVNANGNTALANQSGIELWNARSNTIGGATAGSGNVFSGNINYGINLDSGCHGNTVLGNMIGTDATGSITVSNKYDGVITAAGNTGNQIGGADSSSRNIISGNGYRGIMAEANTGLVIRCNTIGITASGTRLPNGMAGIYLHSCSQITVGGTNWDARNVIGGNEQGVCIDSCTSNTLSCNYMGVNDAGTAVGNHYEGVAITAGEGHTISSNVVSGNGSHGIRLYGSPRCTLTRNLIGTDPTASSGLGNQAYGLSLEEGTSNTLVGGSWLDHGNVISGNALGGIQISGATTCRNVIRGNRIGTDASGMAAIPNHYSGIILVGSPSNTIGSATTSNDRNVISGNDGPGIDIGDGDSTGNLIAGNFIGTDASGTSRLPNTSGGIWIHGASTNTVGSTGSVNRIAFNGGSGIQVESGTGNLLVNNAIYRNSVLGIDLGLGTVTANDPGDSDSGPNRLQNFPVLLSVSNLGAQVRVVWTLDSVPNNSVVVEFYGSTGPDQSSYGEGEYSLGRTPPLTTPPAGLLTGTNLLTLPNPPPNFITATASHATLYDTSEFCQRIMLDSDNDGMPDGYETLYFGGYTNGVPTGDADHDGVSNLSEFTADTNPQSSNSVMRVTGISVSGNTFVLTAPTSLERNYQVQLCTNLVATSQWSVISTVFSAPGNDARFTGTRSNAAGLRLQSSLP